MLTMTRLRPDVPTSSRLRRMLASARTLMAALTLAGGMAAAPAQEEVPFITTPDQVTLAMLQLAGVTAQDHVIDLGSGDGRIVITAAKRLGARGLGVEIAPDLVVQSRRNARTAGVADRTEFQEQDLFQTDLSRAQVITMYLLPEVNLQLRPRLLALAPGTRIVSHDWDMGDWLPERSVTLAVPEKSIGLDKRSTVHLWVVPARVHGLWCTAGALLDITQRFQTFSASLSTPGAAAPLMVVDGRVAGERLLVGKDPAVAPLALSLVGNMLQLSRATGAAGAFEGRRFTRAGAQGCT